MDCIYIAPLSKALYNFLPLIHPFTHTFTHQRQLAAMQGTNQLVRSNWGLGVLLRDTSTRPGWDRTGNPPTARRQLYLLSHIAPQVKNNFKAQRVFTFPLIKCISVNLETKMCFHTPNTRFPFEVNPTCSSKSKCF